MDKKNQTGRVARLHLTRDTLQRLDRKNLLEVGQQVEGGNSGGGGCTCSVTNPTSPFCTLPLFTCAG